MAHWLFERYDLLKTVRLVITELGPILAVSEYWSLGRVFEPGIWYGEARTVFPPKLYQRKHLFPVNHILFNTLPLKHDITKTKQTLYCFFFLLLYCL